MMTLALITACIVPPRTNLAVNGSQGGGQKGPGGGPASVARPLLTVDETGSTQVESAQLAAVLDTMTLGELSAEESAALTYMREEEKLAHDVYVTLGEQWQLPIFTNIAGSETTHTEAIKTLLDRYGLADPVAGNGVGVFTDATLQGLYDQLVADGAQSLAAALTVGATIEDLDIVDLEQRIAQTDNADIKLVFSNLMQGSRNHLRAFVSTLERQTGERYQPQYLDQTAYDAIISSDMERGGRGQGRGQR
ncbi:MAG: DUF2202 domain-containing protein [Caldilineaceae bacterium]